MGKLSYFTNGSWTIVDDDASTLPPDAIGTPVYTGDNEPASPKAGDVWFDGNDGNTPKVYQIVNNVGSWTSIQDADIASAIGLAGSKNQTFFEATEPTVGPFVDGDLWFDTSNDNKIYVYQTNDFVPLELGANALAAGATGGLNVFSYKDVPVNTSGTQNITVETVYNGFKTVVSAGPATMRINNVIGSDGPWTFSCEAKASQADNISVDICDILDSENSSFSLTTEFQHIECIVDLTAEQAALGYIDINGLATGITYEFKNVKIEKGSRSTDWSPNPLDVAERIYDVEVAADQTHIYYSTDAPSGDLINGVPYMDGDTWFKMLAVGDTKGIESIYYYDSSLPAGSRWVNKVLENGVFGNIDASKITTGFLSGSRIEAGSLTADKVIIGSGSNLLSDPSFAIAKLWDTADCVGGSFEANTGMLGSNAAKFLTNGTTKDVYSLITENNVVRVVPGSNYRVGCWVKANNTLAGSKIRIYGSWLNTDGAVQGSWSTTYTLGIAANTWVNVVGLTGEVPANSNFTNLGIEIASSTTSGITIWICEPSIQQAAGGELIVDGAITTNKLDANAITADKIATDAVTADKIEANAVTAAKIKAGEITVDKVVADFGKDLNIESNEQITLRVTSTDMNTAISGLIQSTVVEYYLSSSSTTLLGGSWSETAPAWDNDKYMWTRTKLTTKGGAITYEPSETGTCISGAKGSTGDAGLNALNVVLSNENCSVPANFGGNVSNYAGTGTKINVYEGSSELTYDGTGTSNGTWKVVASGSNITPSSPTDSGQYATYGDHSVMGQDTALITYTISGKRINGTVFSILRTQNFTKAKAGTDGSSGANGIRTAILEMYQWAASAPTTFPSGTSTYTWANGTFTPQTNNGWTLLPGTGTAGQTLWGCRQVYSDQLTESTSTVTWSTNTAYATGASGTNGTSGINAIIGILSNESATVPADFSGTVTSWATASTTMSVYNGTTDDSANWTYTQAATNCTLDSTDIGTPANRRATLTAMSADTATVKITASRTGYSNIEKIFTITKSKAGTNGSSPTSYWLVSDTLAIAKNVSGAYTPASIIVSAKSQTGLNAPAAYSGRFTIDESTDGTNYTNKYTSSVNESTATYELINNIKTLRIRMYLAGGVTTLLDEIIVPIVNDGAAGTNAVSGYLTNETVTVPTASNGSGYSFTSAGGIFKVFNGTTDVTTSSTFSGGATKNGLTLAIVSNTGEYSLSGTWTSNAESFSLTATYSGTTITKVYTIAKSKAGAPGSAGSSAKVANIIASSQVFKSTDGGVTFSPAAITLKPSLQVVTYSKWQYSTNGGTSWVDAASGSHGITIGTVDSVANSLTLDETSDLYTTAITAVSFKLITNDANISDNITIVKLYDVADLKVGGRNIVPFTNVNIDTVGNFVTSGSVIGLDTTNKFLDNNTIKIDLASSNGGIKYNGYLKLRRDTTYTYSMMMRSTDALSFTSSAPLLMWTDVSETGSVPATQKHTVQSYTPSITAGAWTKVYIIFTTANDQDQDVYYWKPFVSGGFSTGTGKSINVCNIKCEEGNKATDWSPNPEDVENRVSGVKQTITDMGYTSLVSQVEEINKAVVTNTTLLNHTSNSFDIQVGKLQNTVDGQASIINDVSKYMTFDINGLTISENMSEFEVNIDANAINFIKGRDTSNKPIVVAKITDQDMTITNAQINYDLTFGYHTVRKQDGLTIFRSTQDGAI